MQIDLGYKPHKFQQIIHQQAAWNTVVVAHRRFGKTYTAVMTLVRAALTSERSYPVFGYLAPFKDQARRLAWNYLKQFCLKIPGARPSEQHLSIAIPRPTDDNPRNFSLIQLFGADNAEALRGSYFDGLVIDEMADMKPDIIGSIIEPALTNPSFDGTGGRNGWAMYIGTPKGMNQFSQLYNQVIAGEKGDSWKAMMFRLSDTKLLTEQQQLKASKNMSAAQMRQEWECDFSASCDNVLITIDMITESIKRDIKEHDLRHSPKIIGVDVARFGDDRSVIQKRWGLFAFEPLIYRNVDNMDLAARVANIITDWEPDAVFIDAGRGEGVIDRLRQLGHSIVEVNFGGKPIDPHYADKRTEMWNLMKEWLEAGGKIQDNLQLTTDLCVPTYAFNATNRMKLESKDDIKKRGLHSPDTGDSLALTFAHPVQPRDHKTKTYGNRHRAEFDPFSGPAWEVPKHQSNYDPFSS